jgi:hypothetical protein
VNRYWVIANSGVAFDNYSAIWTYVAGDVDGGATASAFGIGKADSCNGSLQSCAWTYPTIVGTPTNTNAQASGMTSFSSFAAGTNVRSFQIKDGSNNNIPQESQGTPFSITITALNQTGSTATNFTGTVDLTCNGCTFSSGGGTTASFVNGVLVTPVTISTTGSASITATRTGGTEVGTSNSFNVVATVASFNVVEPGANAVTGKILTKIAGQNFALDVVALDGSNAVSTGFTGAVTLEVVDNTTGGGVCANMSVIATFTNQTFVAGDNGRHALSGANLSEANVWRNAKMRVKYPTSSPTITSCSGDNFAIRPSGFTISISDADWQTAGTARALNNVSTSPGGTAHKAGRAFTVTATVSPATATNYDGNITVVSGGLACRNDYGLTGCATGGLSLGAWSGAGVSRATNTATYGEAGSFDVTLEDLDFASQDSADGSSYIVAQTGGAFATGRFVPNHFSASLNSPSFTTACASGSFTYLGQAFNYATPPIVTVTAQNATGGTTSNYKGALWQITNSTLSGRSYTAASGTLDTSLLPATASDPTINSAAANGTGTLTFSSGSGLNFSRTTPVAAFDADISLAINVADADGVVYESPIGTSANPVRFGAATAGNGIAFSSGKPMRFGRLRILNATGVATLALDVPIRTEYWTGSGFAVNTLDSCTTLDRANITLDAYAKSLNACETAVSTATVSFAAGVGTLRLSRPGAGNEGSVNLTPQLGAAASGNYCAASPGAESASSAAMKSYLQGAWTGTTYDKNPTARGAFGTFGAQPRNFIFFREN